MPSSVRKLRSLLERSESKATEAASKKDAWDDFTDLSYEWCPPLSGYASRGRLFDINESDISSTQSITSPSSQKRGGGGR